MKQSHLLGAISIQDGKLLLVKDSETGLWDIPQVRDDNRWKTDERKMIHDLRIYLGTDLEIKSKLGDVEMEEGKELKRLSLFEVRLLGGFNFNDPHISEWRYMSQVEIVGIEVAEQLRLQVIPLCVEKGILPRVQNS